MLRMVLLLFIRVKGRNMKKYAKVIDNRINLCQVGLGNNEAYYKSIGMRKMDVEQAYNGDWYVEGYAPEEPAPTEEEQREKRAAAYQVEVDPITSHISRLRDMEQTEEVIAEIEKLKQERDDKVEEIKRRYPYPVEA